MRAVWIGIVFIFCLMSSCVDEVTDTSSTPVPDNLVVHAFVNPDSSIKVSLAMVVGVNDPDRWINDAEVYLVHDNGSMQALKFLNNGEYEISAAMNANDSVRIRIMHPKFTGIIRARIPNKVVIQKVDTFSTLVSGLGKTKGYRLYFKDSAYLKNYYQISLWRIFWKFNATATDSQLMKEKINIAGNEAVFIRNQYNQYTSKEILFSDEIINGVNNHLEVYEELPRSSITDQRTVNYQLILDNLNEGYYNYINSRNAHIWQQNSITQLPMRVSGNISSVYGVLGVYTNQSVVLSP